MAKVPEAQRRAMLLQAAGVLGAWGEAPDEIPDDHAAHAAGHLLAHPEGRELVVPALVALFGPSMAKAIAAALDSGSSPHQALLLGFAQRNQEPHPHDDPTLGARLSSAMAGVTGGQHGHPPPIPPALMPAEPTSPDGKVQETGHPTAPAAAAR